MSCYARAFEDGIRIEVYFLEMTSFNLFNSIFICSLGTLWTRRFSDGSISLQQNGSISSTWYWPHAPKLRAYGSDVLSSWWVSKCNFDNLLWTVIIHNWSMIPPLVRCMDRRLTHTGLNSHQLMAVVLYFSFFKNSFELLSRNSSSIIRFCPGWIKWDLLKNR